jgi:hypothetical protein
MPTDNIFKEAEEPFVDKHLLGQHNQGNRSMAMGGIGATLGGGLTLASGGSGLQSLVGTALGYLIGWLASNFFDGNIESAFKKYSEWEKEGTAEQNVQAAVKGKKEEGKLTPEQEKALSRATQEKTNLDNKNKIITAANLDNVPKDIKNVLLDPRYSEKAVEDFAVTLAEGKTSGNLTAENLNKELANSPEYHAFPETFKFNKGEEIVDNSPEVANYNNAQIGLNKQKVEELKKDPRFQSVAAQDYFKKLPPNPNYREMLYTLASDNRYYTPGAGTQPANILTQDEVADLSKPVLAKQINPVTGQPVTVISQTPLIDPNASGRIPTMTENLVSLPFALANNIPQGMQENASKAMNYVHGDKIKASDSAYYSDAVTKKLSDIFTYLANKSGVKPKQSVDLGTGAGMVSSFLLPVDESTQPGQAMAASKIVSPVINTAKAIAKPIQTFNNIAPTINAIKGVDLLKGVTNTVKSPITSLAHVVSRPADYAKAVSAITNPSAIKAAASNVFLEPFKKPGVVSKVLSPLSMLVKGTSMATKALPVLQVAETGTRGLLAATNEKYRDAARDRMLDSGLGTMALDSFTGRGLENIVTTGVDIKDDFKSGINNVADYLEGNISKEQFDDISQKYVDEAGQGLYDSPWGRQVSSRPPEHIEQAESDAIDTNKQATQGLFNLYKKDRHALYNQIFNPMRMQQLKKLDPQQYNLLVQEQKKYPSPDSDSFANYYTTATKQHMQNMLETNPEIINKPLMIGGNVQSLYEAMNSAKTPQERNAHRQNLDAFLKSKVGTYAPMYMDALEGSDGNYAVLPQNLGQMIQYEKLTNKKSPGQEFFRSHTNTKIPLAGTHKTKYKSFQEILDAQSKPPVTVPAPVKTAVTPVGGLQKNGSEDIISIFEQAKKHRNRLKV